MYIAYCTDRSPADDIALLGGNYRFEPCLASSKKVPQSSYYLLYGLGFFHYFSLSIDHTLLINICKGRYNGRKKKSPSSPVVSEVAWAREVGWGSGT